MQKIDRTFVENIRIDINEALEAVGKKYGLTIKAGSASYSDANIDFKLNVCDPKANWNNSIRFTPLKPQDFGKEGLFGAQRLKIVGFDNGARTNKVQLEDAHGKRYHATIDQTVDALNRADPSRAAASSSTTAPKPEATMVREFETKAFMCGLKGKVSYGQTFEYNRDTYKIIDLNTRAPKFPIVAENIKNGKQYRFPADVLN